MQLKTFDKGKTLLSRIAMLSLCLFFLLSPFLLPAQDPTGAKTGTLSDIDTMAVKVLDSVANARDTTVAAASASINKLAAAVQTIGAADGHNKIANGDRNRCFIGIDHEECHATLAPFHVVCKYIHSRRFVPCFVHFGAH